MGVAELDELRDAWAVLLRDDPEGVRIELCAHQETIAGVDPDGRLVVRKRGGPIHYMGSVSNFMAAVVPAWRAQIAPPRHRAMLDHLRAAAFPVGLGADGTFVPDEIPSVITLEHRSGRRATMLATHNAVEGNRDLAYVVGELGALATLLASKPPTARLPNPELDEWSKLTNVLEVPDEVAAPKPTADAARAAQAAVDGFYAQRWAEQRAHIAARYDARPPPAPSELACSFPCVTTRAVAGTLTLRAGPVRVTLRLSGFKPTGDFERTVTPAERARVEAALRDGDARALYGVDPELVPFFCARCGLCYAASEWKTYDVSAASVDGVCPRGHRQPLRSD